MKIILKYLLNNLKERKTRTAVMLLSVILSTTMLFVSLSIGASYSVAQKTKARGSAGKAEISVSALDRENGGKLWISEDDVPDIASIKNKVGILKSTALYHKDGYFDNLDIISADIDKLNKINRPRLLDGSELNNFSRYQVVLPQRFTAKYNIHKGDDFELKIGGRTVAFKIAAIAAYDTVFLRETRGATALIPQDAMKEILNSGGKYSEVLVQPATGVNVDTLKAELSKVLSTKEFSVKKIIDQKQVEASAREKTLPLFLVSFFTMTMSIFIIYSSYKVITLERLPAIGTFRSIGANEKTVFKILLGESLLYGILGGIAGIPVGLAVLKVMLLGFGNSESVGINIPMIVAPINIIVSCLTSILVSMLSAFIPIKHASKLPIKDVIFGTLEEKQVSNKAKLVFSIILIVLSTIMPRISSEKLLIPAGGLSLVFLIAAAILIIPFFTNGIAYLLERVYRYIFGNEGQLAARNMSHNKNVSQNITLLFISISSVIVITVIGSFLVSYMSDMARGATGDGVSEASMNQEFINQVKSIKGMKEVLPIHMLNSSTQVEGIAVDRVMSVLDLKLYTSMFNLRYENKNDQNRIEGSFKNERNILLSKNTSKRINVKEGSKVTLSLNGMKQEYTVAGIYKSVAYNASAVIPAQFAVKDFKLAEYSLMGFKADNPQAAVTQIRALFGDKLNWSRTFKEVNEDAAEVVGSFLAPVGKLTYFILLLATIGIINNLLINYIQKRHSIAMYKSLGLSNKQNIKMTLIEGLSSGLIGAALAMAVAYMEIKTIFIAGAPRLEIDPTFNTSVFIVSGILGIAITLLGSIVPILKGSGMKIIEEIKFE